MKVKNLMNDTVTFKSFWKRQRRMNPKTQAAVGGCLVDAFTKATLCTGEEL
jgi:hypothetical protein